MTPSTLLLGIDLEDPRLMIPDGTRYRERVPHNVERLLALAADHRFRCTFFTVGNVARQHPDLVRRIVDAGHEIGCHGDDHTPIDRLGRDGFRADLERCLESLAKLGVSRVRGFRAPMGSMTEATRWGYEILADLGFEYSSSVLATRLPYYGWPGFGGDAPRIVDGICELPLTLTGLPFLNTPLVGGIFLRAIPLPLIERLVRRRLGSAGLVVGYVHPYDVDHQQERFVHPEIGASRLLHWLMYLNRRDALRRLDRLVGLAERVIPFAEYVAETRAAAGGQAQKAS